MSTVNKEAPARQCSGLYHFQNINDQKLTIAQRLTGSRCRCSACGELFNSVSVFDRHRVGSWEGRGVNRHCLTTPQMQAKGWRVNARGFWIERQRIDLPRRSDDHVYTELQV